MYLLNEGLIREKSLDAISGRVEKRRGITKIEKNMIFLEIRAEEI